MNARLAKSVPSQVLDMSALPALFSVFVLNVRPRLTMSIICSKSRRSSRRSPKKKASLEDSSMAEGITEEDLLAVEISATEKETTGLIENAGDYLTCSEVNQKITLNSLMKIVN